jgi:hypothetical protein
MEGGRGALLRAALASVGRLPEGTKMAPHAEARGAKVQ